MKLYNYWRSSASYRVRIALGLKGLDWEEVTIHLLRGGGEQFSESYRAVNPQKMVPALVLDNGQILTQSMAILEYLEERYPAPSLLPGDPQDRAKIRAMANIIACDIHPLNNLRVLAYLAKAGIDAQTKTQWYRHWITEGLEALEQLSASRDGAFCYGNQPGLADICLIPQLYNARRFDVDLTPYPRLTRVETACQAVPAFARAVPQDPDASGPPPS